MQAFQVYCDGVKHDKPGCNSFATFCRWIDGSDNEKPLEEITNTKPDTKPDTVVGQEKIDPMETDYCPARESILILTENGLYYRTPEGYGNVALGADVSASSLFAPQRPHSHLTDGDKTDDNFAHTKCDADEWFEVNLGDEFYIDQWEDDSASTPNLEHDIQFKNPILTQFIRVKARKDANNCFHFRELEAYGDVESQLEICADGLTGARDLAKTDKYIYVTDEMGNSVYRIEGLCGEKKVILSQNDGTWVQQPRAIAVKERDDGTSVVFVSMMQADIGWATAKNPGLSQHRQVYYIEMDVNGIATNSGILGNSNTHGAITALNYDSDSNVLWGVSENKYVAKYVNGEWVKLNENSQVVDMRQIDFNLHGKCKRTYYAADDNNAIFECVDPAKPETCTMQCPSTVMNPWAVESGVDCSIYTGSTGSADGSNYEVIKYDEQLCGKAFVIETVSAPIYDIIAFEDETLINLCLGEEKDKKVKCGVCDFEPKACEEEAICDLGLERSDKLLCGPDDAGIDCGKDICCTPAQCGAPCDKKYEPSGDEFCYANGCENCCDLVQLPCSTNAQCKAGEVESGEQFCGGDDNRDCSVCCEPIQCDTIKCSAGEQRDEKFSVCNADSCDNCCEPIQCDTIDCPAGYELDPNQSICDINGCDNCCKRKQCDEPCGAKYEPSGDKFCDIGDDDCKNCCNLVQLPCSSNGKCQAGEVASGKQFCGGADNRDCSVYCEPIQCDTIKCSAGKQRDENFSTCKVGGCDNCCEPIQCDSVDCPAGYELNDKVPVCDADGCDNCCKRKECKEPCGAKYEPSGDTFCDIGDDNCKNCCDLVQLPCSSNRKCQAGEVPTAKQYCGGVDNRDCSVCCKPKQCSSHKCSPGYKLDDKVTECDADGCENCCTTFCAINTIRQGDKCLPRTTPPVYYPPHTECADLRRSGTDANVKGKTINGITFDTVKPTSNGIYVIIQDADLNGGPYRYSGGAYNNGCIGFSGLDLPKILLAEIHVFLTVADLGDINPNSYDENAVITTLQGFDQNGKLVAEHSMLLTDQSTRDACDAANNGGGSGSFVFSLDYPPGIKYVQVNNPNAYIFDANSAWSDICGAEKK
eukprot:Awhi_evm1s4058